MHIKDLIENSYCNFKIETNKKIRLTQVTGSFLGKALMNFKQYTIMDI